MDFFYIFAFKFERRGSVMSRVPQRDIGIVVWPVLRFFVFIRHNKGNMELNIIQHKIHEIRGARVIMDYDLAEL